MFTTPQFFKKHIFLERMILKKKIFLRNTNLKEKLIYKADFEKIVAHKKSHFDSVYHV